MSFENEDIIIVNKPAGWLTHPDGQEQRPSVTEWLHCDVGIHSRLDVDTTGVLAFSKSEAGHRKLRTQHQEDSLNKTYLAVVSAAPSPRSGQMVDRMPNGKRAELKYTTQQINEHFAVIQITLVTGRTHQIRFQFAQRGYPLIGDARFGDAIDRRAPRTLLHAQSIHLNGVGEIKAPIPDDFALPMGLEPASARKHLKLTSHTTAYREFNGVVDGHPGWIVDRYGDFLWVRQDAGLDGPMPEALGHYGLPAPKDRSRYSNPGAVHLWGKKVNDRLWVEENGVAYDVRFEGERSTGIFLDQRPQRAWLRERGNGMEVLNTFAHSGAFSVAVGVAGGSSLNLDLSKKWLSRIPDQITQNGGDPKHHPFIHGDVFEWLPRLRRQGRTFDLVILDPPSTSVGKKRKRWSAAKQYSELVALAAPLIKPGGKLWASTNHRQTLPRSFAKRVKDGLTPDFEFERVCPQPVDHPTLGPAPLKVLVWKRH